MHEWRLGAKSVSVIEASLRLLAVRPLRGCARVAALMQTQTQSTIEFIDCTYGREHSREIIVRGDTVRRKYYVHAESRILNIRATRTRVSCNTDITSRPSLEKAVQHGSAISRQQLLSNIRSSPRGRKRSAEDGHLLSNPRLIIDRRP